MKPTREGPSQDHFDLFPYIAILMSFLGVLLVVTLGVASLSLGPGAGETWDLAAPDGTAKKTPVLLEWDGRDLRVHAGDGRRQVAWQEGGPAATQRSAAMRQLLAEFKASRDSRYAVFAVRPSGFDSFQRVADDFRSMQVDVGYEPIGQDRPVVLLGHGRQP